MPVYAITYAYGPEDAPTRSALLLPHRDWLGALEEQDRLLGAGVYADASGALLIITAESRKALNRVLADDPFSGAGAILSTTVHEWAPARGTLAATSKAA